MKLLYTAKGIWSQLQSIKQSIKKMYNFEVFKSWNKLYLFLCIQLVFQFYTHSTLYHVCFQVLTTNTFCFWFFQAFLFCVCFYKFKAENIYFKFFLNWFNTVLSQITLLSREVFCDYLINLGNTANSNSSLIFGGGELYGGLDILLRDLKSP